MKNKKVYYSDNISFWITIVFIILKLNGVIDWSWWWVFSPLLISFSLMILFCIVFGAAAIVWVNYSSKEKNR